VATAEREFIILTGQESGTFNIQTEKLRRQPFFPCSNSVLKYAVLQHLKKAVGLSPTGSLTLS